MRAEPLNHVRTLTTGTLIAACFAVFIAQVGLAAPATLNGLFQADLHPVGSQLTWISDAFLIPVAALELTFGVLGDLFGRKRLLVIGALLLAAGEAISASAPHVQLLWAGQALAGLGAATLFPTSLAMLAVGTHTTRDRARAIALWAGFLSLGGVTASVLGGLTGNFGSWRWTFIAIMILALLCGATGLVLAQNSSAAQGRSLDWPGQITLTVSLVALLYSIIQGPTDGWGSTPVIVGFAVAVISMSLFITVESRVQAPLLRLDLFRNRSFAVVSIVTLVGMFSFLGTAYATSLRLGPIQHQSPLRIAVAFVLLQGPSFLLIPLTGRLIERVNPRWLLASGFAIMAIGQLLAARLPISDLTLTALIVPFGLVGIGFVLSVSSVTANAVNAVPVQLAGMASATTSMLRDLGFTMGPALIGAVALSNAASRFSSALPGLHLPPSQAGPAAAIAHAGGPLAINSLPPGVPGSAAHQAAFDALGHGYSIGYALCAICALAAALLTVTALGRKRADLVEENEFLASPIAAGGEPDTEPASL
jgi:MFS family permease